MTRKCYECGHTKENEIEYKTVTTDEGDGKEKKIKLWLCKDYDDCQTRMYNKYHANN